MARMRTEKEVDPEEHNKPLPAQPTQAQPGTEDKIAVLCERAERGEALFHPLDKSVALIPLDCGQRGPVATRPWGFGAATCDPDVEQFGDDEDFDFTDDDDE